MTGKTNLADVQEALKQKMVMMHVLQPKGNVTGPSLGPTITVELSVEVQVKASWLILDLLWHLYPLIVC